MFLIILVMKISLYFSHKITEPVMTSLSAITLKGKNHDETVLVLRCDEMTRESCVDLRTGPRKCKMSAPHACTFGPTFSNARSRCCLDTTIKPKKKNKKKKQRESSSLALLLELLARKQS